LQIGKTAAHLSSRIYCSLLCFASFLLGLEPLLPIYQRGILYGNPSIREVSASGLGELISITSTKFLTGPLIIKMTGPLLRVVGDRNPANVKIAILKTLGLILVKGGPALRAFVPQFQTTFVKALSDPSRQVRMEAIDALSLLMPLSTRVDPLIKELVSGSLGKTVSSEEVGASAVQTATLEALAAVLYHGGVKAKLPDSVPSALEASKELLSAVDDGIREAAAKVMGMACSLSGAAVTEQVLRDEILKTTDQDSSTVRHGKACAIRRILASDIGSEIPSILPDLKKLVLTYLKDDKSTVREAAFVAFGAVIGRSPDPKDAFKANESVLMSTLRDSKDSIDMERAVARGFCVALVMLDGAKRVDTMGLVLIDACLQATLKGSQRVQFAFNDVLWLVLDVEAGQDGLDRYASKAIFDSVRAMKSLHSKVLMRITTLSILKE
jgi:HEAT repeat protein